MDLCLAKIFNWITSVVWVHLFLCLKGGDIRLPYRHNSVQVTRECRWEEILTEWWRWCLIRYFTISFSLTHLPISQKLWEILITLKAQRLRWNWMKLAQRSKSPSTSKNKAANKNFRITVPVNGISPVWELEIGDADLRLLNVPQSELAKTMHTFQGKW